MSTITPTELYNFFPAARKIKMEVVESTKKRIETLDITKIRNEDSIDMAAIRLCMRAFKTYERKIQATYSESRYKDLVAIAVDREAAYFTAPYFLHKDLCQLISQKINQDLTTPAIGAAKTEQQETN